MLEPDRRTLAEAGERRDQQGLLPQSLPVALRIFEGELSASDLAAPILVVSQFTLYAETRKGRRPSWSAAAPGATSEPLVAAYARALTRLGAEVSSGVFGAHMQVELVNDGPVTIILDSADWGG